MGKSKIHLLLSINFWHGNVTEGRWLEFDRNKGGLEAIGKSGVPCSLNGHAIDFELYPWLADIVKKYDNIQLAYGTYSHSFLEFIPKEYRKWELANGLEGSIPVCFFAEFFNPHFKLIPCKYFWVLDEHTYRYSEPDSFWHDIEVPQKESVGRIDYHDKVGIIMRGYNELLSAFFYFQRFPNRPESQEKLHTAIQNAINSDYGMIVLPIDLEAPFVGSYYGPHAWEKFFTFIKEHYADDFVGFGQVQAYVDAQPEHKAKPHRITTKWGSHPVQIRYLQSFFRIQPNSREERRLYAIMTIMDILAAWERKVAEQVKRISFTADKMKPDTVGDWGMVEKECFISVTYSQLVVECILAARYALENQVAWLDVLEGKHKTGDYLKNMPKNHPFLGRLIAYAKKYNL